jgi:hypothetical protein
MRANFVVSALLALMVAPWSGVAMATAADEPKAGPEGPKATELVFDHKHLQNVGAGKEIDYRFNRTVSDVAMLGQAFSDDITLKVVDAKPTGERDVDLQIYTGERARELQKLPGLTINPVFLVYFNQGVNTFHQLAGGQQPYLTRAFSTGFKDKAKVEPVKVNYQGKEINAFRITMQPYVGDPNESKMQGWEGAQYTLVLSNEVPGEIVDLIANYKNKYAEKNLRVVERITLNGVTGLEDVK